jgi:hypothetical protein
MAEFIPQSLNRLSIDGKIIAVAIRPNSAGGRRFITIRTLTAVITDEMLTPMKRDSLFKNVGK